MSKIPSHIVDEIMQTALVEEVVGEFVQLKRAGSNLKGLSLLIISRVEGRRIKVLTWSNTG